MEILSKDSIALREPILGGGILLHSKGNVVGDNVERKGLLLHFGLETGAGHFSYIEVAADFEIVGFKLFDALHHLLQLNKLLVLEAERNTAQDSSSKQTDQNESRSVSES